MSSRWQHALCDPCWFKRNPDRTPVRVRYDEGEVFGDVDRCCDCGLPTTSGIYVREDPSALPCGGRHALAIEP